MAVARLFPARFSGGSHIAGGGLKIASRFDPDGQWRAEGFAGCWLPPGVAKISDPRGEFCIRPDAIMRVNAASEADMKCHPEIRQTEWLLLTSHPRCSHRFRRKMRMARWPAVLLGTTAACAGIGLGSHGFYGLAMGAGSVVCAASVSLAWT